MTATEETSKSERLLAAAKRRREEGRIVEVDEQRLKMVVFRCGTRHYAFNGLNIREILTPREIFWAPGLPPYLPGLINVRGDIESVVDLRFFLGEEPDEAAAQRQIVVAVAGDFISGVLVDRVEDVLDIPASSVKPPPAGLSEEVRELVAGEFEYDGATVVLLDAGKLATRVTLA